MIRTRTNPMQMLRRQAKRLLPVLALGLVGLQAQASCQVASETDLARADAAWVMHQSVPVAGAHAGHQGHGSMPAPACDHGDGDACLQVVSDVPEGATALASDLDLPVLLALPAPAPQLVALEAGTVPPRADAVPIPERPPHLRFVRFLE